MGDAADLALDGEMYDLDYDSELPSDPDTGEPLGGWPAARRRSRPPESPEKTCKWCGETGLKWFKTPSGWRLAHGESLHVCPDRIPP